MKKRSSVKIPFAIFAVCMVTAGITYNLELIKAFCASAAGMLVSAAVLVKCGKEK